MKPRTGLSTMTTQSQFLEKNLCTLIDLKSKNNPFLYTHFYSVFHSRLHREITNFVFVCVYPSLSGIHVTAYPGSDLGSSTVQLGSRP